jgi:DNA-binding transcriptional ArsR family regulator
VAADPLAALASPRRREILRLVWEGERSAGQIAAAFDVSWPAISQNLRVLREAGLVRERRAGTSRLYSADRKALQPLAAYLRRMWTRDIGRLADLAEAEEEARSKS